MQNNSPTVSSTTSIDPLVIDGLLESIKSTLRSVGYSRAGEFSAALFSWLKLSLENQIPENHSVLHNRHDWSESRVAATEQFLTSQNDIAWSLAFNGLSKRQGVGRGGLLGHVVDMSLAVFNRGTVDWKILASILCEKFISENNQFSISHEVAQLCASLVPPSSNDALYCPFQNSLAAAVEYSKTGRASILESELQTSFFAAIAILMQNSLTVAFSDPISHPSFIEHGKLKQFENGLAITNIGWKRVQHSGDLFNRFSSNSLSEVTDTLHLLAQVKHKAVALVPISVLFKSSRDAREFREQIVNSGILKAMILLSNGVLEGANIATCVLLFDKLSPTSGVFMLDASGEHFTETRKERRSSRLRLQNIDEIVRLVEQRADSEIAKTVTADEIANQGYDLSLGNYLLSAEQETVAKLLTTAASSTLGDVAEIIRGQAVKAGSGQKQYEFFEVGASNIRRDGVISQPSKSVMVDEKEAHSSAFSSLRLEPNDIVLAIKGSVGIVGMVHAPQGEYHSPHLFDTETGEEITYERELNSLKGQTNWIVGQSYAIIRARPHIIAPETLLMYLKSNVAQSWLKSKATGSTVPMLQKQYLNGLPVIVPSLADGEAIRAKFHQLVETENEIKKLESRFDELVNSCWEVKS